MGFNQSVVYLLIDREGKELFIVNRRNTLLSTVLYNVYHVCHKPHNSNCMARVSCDGQICEG